MLTIRSRTFESNEIADTAFSRLDWKVEKVTQLFNPLLNFSTVETTKPWVGKIDREKKEFKISQTAPYFPFFSTSFLECNFFRLYILGRVIGEEQGTKINLRFRLGLSTVIFFILIYLSPILIFSVNWQNGIGNWKEHLFGLTIPTICTLLLVLQLNTTENKLIELFDL